jgi:hypothetical protein
MSMRVQLLTLQKEEVLYEASTTYDASVMLDIKSLPLDKGPLKLRYDFYEK